VLDPRRLPFGPREAILRVPEWDKLNRDWGTGNNN